MKHLLIAAALGLATLASAAPPATTPAAPPATAAPAAGIPPECVEKIRAHFERMKKELGLSEAQAAALRNEHERYRGTLLTARAEHRSALAKILTAEQLAKVEDQRAGMRQKRMETCGEGLDDAPMQKRKH